MALGFFCGLVELYHPDGINHETDIYFDEEMYRNIIERSYKFGQPICYRKISIFKLINIIRNCSFIGCVYMEGK